MTSYALNMLRTVNLCHTLAGINFTAAEVLLLSALIICDS